MNIKNNEDKQMESNKHNLNIYDEGKKDNIVRNITSWATDLKDFIKWNVDKSDMREEILKKLDDVRVFGQSFSSRENEKRTIQ